MDPKEAPQPTPPVPEVKGPEKPPTRAQAINSLNFFATFFQEERDIITVATGIKGIGGIKEFSIHTGGIFCLKKNLNTTYSSWPSLKVVISTALEYRGERLIK